MGSPYAALFPPGTDLCQVPSGQPPEGQAPDFGAEGLKPVVISLSVILTTIAVAFGLGRLFVNLRKLQWSDLFVLFVILLNIGYTVVLIIYSRYFRHAWDVPLCWLDGRFEQISYVWQSVSNISLFFSKTATLLLLRQVFSVSRLTNIAIWIGIAYDFVIYATSLILATYWATPRPGQSWDQYINGSGSTAQYIIYLAIGQGAASILLDTYMFILPLPIIARLNLSANRKWRIGAIFLVASLGVVASIISFVYRVLELTESASLYLGSVVLLANLIEMDIALIVCCAPAFATFMRVYVLQSPAYMSIRTLLPGRSKDTTSIEAVPGPNKPRTGRDTEKRADLERLRGQVGMSDTWLFEGRAASDVETQTRRPESHERHISL
ncbi:hypothetical protein E0Z10_g9731 [Xylaria hypoxylon]|uniref:Rhodopsin domain-containing protein n=1 Tax=Xylaria hypoxylon TaxID=37992 RepID=A0A4Z0YGF0_9PEZI|nr:hypothetical protein E0Z10_g9731 [Xylaria hypoxylon]